MKVVKSSRFLIYFLIILLVVIGLIKIVRSFTYRSDIKAFSNQPFLQISDEKVDSVIAVISLQDKINQLIQIDCSDYESDALFDAHSLSVHPKLINDGRTMESNQSCYNSIDHGFNFTTLPDHSLLNSICDTTYLAEFLYSRLNFPDNNTYNIPLFCIDSLMVKNLSDSIYSDFYLNRMVFFRNKIWNRYKLHAVSIQQADIKVFALNINSSNAFLKKFGQTFQNSVDIVVIDSVNQFFQFPFHFNGLVFIRPGQKFLDDKHFFLEFFKSNADVFYVKDYESLVYKQILNDLIANKQISEIELNLKLRKIIRAKLWMGQGKISEMDYTRLPMPEEYHARRLSKASIALLTNPDSTIPFQNIENQKYTVLWLGKIPNKDFIQNLNHYTLPKTIVLDPDRSDWKSKTSVVFKKNICILVIDTLISDSITKNQLKQLLEEVEPRNLLIINFKNYQNLEFVPEHFALIQCQSRNLYDYTYAAQAVFGGIPLDAQLSLHVSEIYHFGLRSLSPKTRLNYAIPEEAGLCSEKLNEIEKIAYAAISGGAFPGCQVFVAKKGQVVYNKSFGNHSYSSKSPVQNDDLYDLASVTKIAATTIAAMKMISDGKMNLNDHLGKFFKDTKIDYTRIKPDTVVRVDSFFRTSAGNWHELLADPRAYKLNDTSLVIIDTIIYKLTPKLNIFKVLVIDLLKHQSGIAPYMPISRYMFYKSYFIEQLKKYYLVTNGKNAILNHFNSYDLPENFPENTKLHDTVKRDINLGFKKQYQEFFSAKYVKDSSDIKLTEHLYLRNKYFDTIWRDTKQLPVYSRKVFIYSDVNMILLQMAIDSLNKQNMDQFMKKNFFQPLGLKYISYLPLNYFQKNKIIPTENDKSWRYAELQGYVHDPSAALLGGLAGNAGLFSNAHDLGVLFQMVLNKGIYGGRRYLKANLVEQFITRFDETQRGLGFDMPNKKARVGSLAPLSTFGHSGFTGTCVWVDPENELVYVFLANRNHPNPDNWRINGMQIRERIHDAVYKAMIGPNQE